jgi:hypothetical protein
VFFTGKEVWHHPKKSQKCGEKSQKYGGKWLKTSKNKR